MTENLTGTELVADGLIKRYGKREVLKGVSLNAKPGEIVGLLGPNGAGKTTTFSILAGFTLPDAGSLRLGEIDLTRLPPHKRAKNGLVYLPQESSVFTNFRWRIIFEQSLKHWGFLKVIKIEWFMKDWRNSI